MIDNAVMADFTISVAPVKRKARELGITSISQLSKQAGIPYITARRWWQDDVTQIHADTLAALAELFGCEPGELVEKREIDT